MKKTILTSLLIIALAITTSIKAQVGIGVSTANINPSAQLDVSSTTKGFLPPRMTTTQRDAISTPATGLVIFNTTTNSLEYKSSTGWVQLTAVTPTTIGSVSGTSTPNGGTITSGVLNLAPADGTNGGIVTNATQTFAGNKTFNNNLVANGTVGVGTASPSASAKLEVNSTNQGFLPPRMTYAQRNAIVNPGVGLIIYCTNCGTNGEMQYYNVTDWISMEIGIGSIPPSVIPSIPTISTSSISDIMANTVTCGGNISYNGGATVTTRGVCWSKSSNPTIALSTKTSDGRGLGSFTSSITGLTDNTTYHVRSYATNVVGTAYGNEVVFTTLLISVPTITTSSISYLLAGGATCGGNISADGNATVITRGVCWSTSSNPTIALSTKTVDGTGVGSFTSSITGLTATTTYHIRSYATNAGGTAYGNEVLFTTPVLGMIGTQVWTTQNLNVSTYRNGDPIPKVTDNATWASLTTGAYCYYNNDSATYAAIYGKLYNWYAVNDPRGLAPVGYHIPTDAEWTILETTLGADAGTKMKSTSGWDDDGNGNNVSRFGALPGAFCNAYGTFGAIGFEGYWWSSTESNAERAFNRFLDLFSFGNNLNNNDDFKGSGFSVRCIKD